jgi:CRISPR-associated endonuclease Csn1
MRLMIGDCIRANVENADIILKVLKINSSGSITFIKPNETNISARYTAKLTAQKAQKNNEPFDLLALNDAFFQKALSAGSLKDAKARRVTISPLGELRDNGFKE